jgi:neutral ceramidase
MPAAADSTPNVQGTFCLDSGLPCDRVHSTCNGNNQLCWGRGPAWPDHFKSTEIIGQMQAEEARVSSGRGGGQQLLGCVGVVREGV